MALRLVTPETPAKVTTPTERLAGARGAMSRSVVEANQLLIAGDLPAWRKRFAATAEVADDHSKDRAAQAAARM